MAKDEKWKKIEGNADLIMLFKFVGESWLNKLNILKMVEKDKEKWEKVLAELSLNPVKQLGLKQILKMSCLHDKWKKSSSNAALLLTYCGAKFDGMDLRGL